MTSLAADIGISATELLTVVASRELAGRNTVFAGIGLPTLAVSLASMTSAPDLEIVYESGVCGAHPSHLRRPSQTPSSSPVLRRFFPCRCYSAMSFRAVT